MRDNAWIFEQLIATLLEEQMLEAVESVASQVYDLGFQMDSQKMQAFSLMLLGEQVSQQHVKDSAKAERGLEQLLQAHEIY